MKVRNMKFFLTFLQCQFLVGSHCTRVTANSHSGYLRLSHSERIKGQCTCRGEESPVSLLLNRRNISREMTTGHGQKGTNRRKAAWKSQHTSPLQHTIASSESSNSSNKVSDKDCNFYLCPDRHDLTAAFLHASAASSLLQ